MSTRVREPWIDATRAIAVILVVLFHFILWTHRDVTAGSAGLDGHWDTLQRVLGRLRMPILMAISGFLASGAITRGWSSIRTRFAANAWLYVVWLTVYFAFYATAYALIETPRLPVAVNTPQKYFENLVMPETPLWFIVAMATFPLILWGAARLGVPVWLVMVAAVAIWAWGTYGEVPQWIGKYARTFIFFAVGAHARTVAPKLNKLGWPSAIVAFGSFVAASFYFRKALDVQLGVLIAALLALVAVAIAAPVLFRAGWHAKLATAIGKRTLEIYVLHVPLLAVMALLLRDRAWLQEFVSTAWGDGLFVLLAVSAVVAVSLALGTALRRFPGVMDLPESWKRRLLRSSHN